VSGWSAAFHVLVHLEALVQPGADMGGAAEPIGFFTITPNSRHRPGKCAVNRESEDQSSQVKSVVPGHFAFTPLFTLITPWEID